MLPIRDVLCSGYNWVVNNRDVMNTVSTVAKISALAAAAIAVGCVVYVLGTGSLPILSLSIILKRSFQLIMVATNVLSCGRLVKQIVNVKSFTELKAIAGHVAVIFITTMLCIYSDGASHLIAETNRFVVFELGVLINTAMSMRIFSAIRNAFNAEIPMSQRISKVMCELLVGSIGLFALNAYVGYFCGFAGVASYDPLKEVLLCSLSYSRKITAIVIGSSIIAAIAVKIGDIVRNTKLVNNVPDAAPA
jgi:hypothetical protein